MELTITEDVIIHNLIKNKCKYISSDAIDKYKNEYIKFIEEHKVPMYIKLVQEFSFCINQENGKPLDKVVILNKSSINELNREQLGAHILSILGIPELENENQFYSYSCLYNKFVIMIQEFYEADVIEYIAYKLNIDEETVHGLVKEYNNIVSRVEKLRKFVDYGVVPYE